MDINGIIQIIASIVTVIISAVIAPFFLNFFLKRKFQKMQYLIDSKHLLENIDDDFKNNFVKQTVQENLFFIMTGIKTNCKSIPAYIELKDLLGEDYQWGHIKSAKPHLRFGEDGSLIIKLSRRILLFKNATVISSLIFVMLGFSIIIYFSQFEVSKLSEVLLIYILGSPLFILAYFSFSAVTSIIDADRLKKRIEKINDRQ
ncbi:hypothetical protein [Chryseobacterium sp. EZn1]|uniref:hypothetical protein n=1 Tax=Chryseobacterium cupriresistens TaxID=3366770 RepID=UPI0039849DE9